MKTKKKKEDKNSLDTYQYHEIKLLPRQKANRKSHHYTSQKQLVELVEYVQKIFEGVVPK